MSLIEAMSVLFRPFSSVPSCATLVARSTGFEMLRGQRLRNRGGLGRAFFLLVLEPAMVSPSSQSSFSDAISSDMFVGRLDDRQRRSRQDRMASSPDDALNDPGQLPATLLLQLLCIDGYSIVSLSTRPPNRLMASVWLHGYE